VKVLPWLERNCSLVVGRILAGEEAVSRSRENRRLRYQGLPRNIHRSVLGDCLHISRQLAAESVKYHRIALEISH
jgi:hypothetical protein